MMNEMQVLYWIGHFTATGAILCIGLYIWSVLLCCLSDVLDNTIKSIKNIETVLIAYFCLKKGAIKDYEGIEWKIQVVNDKKIIVELKKDLIECGVDEITPWHHGLVPHIKEIKKGKK